MCAKGYVQSEAAGGEVVSSTASAGPAESPGDVPPKRAQEGRHAQEDDWVLIWRPSQASNRKGRTSSLCMNSLPPRLTYTFFFSNRLLLFCIHIMLLCRCCWCTYYLDLQKKSFYGPRCIFKDRRVACCFTVLFVISVFWLNVPIRSKKKKNFFWTIGVDIVFFGVFYTLSNQTPVHECFPKLGKHVRLAQVYFPSDLKTASSEGLRDLYRFYSPDIGL